MAQPWFCYIARCHDESLLVGIAQNLEERFRDSKAARKREKEIKEQREKT